MYWSFWSLDSMLGGVFWRVLRTRRCVLIVLLNQQDASSFDSSMTRNETVRDVARWRS